MRDESKEMMRSGRCYGVGRARGRRITWVERMPVLLPAKKRAEAAREFKLEEKLLAPTDRERSWLQLVLSVMLMMFNSLGMY